MTADNRKKYWQTNLIYLTILLVIWFVVSYVCGIIFAPQLNETRWPLKGFPLGFWFAQQGSIYVFVALIFVYTFLMNRLDRKYDVHEEDEPTPGPAAPAAEPDTSVMTKETKVDMDDLPKAED